MNKTLVGLAVLLVVFGVIMRILPHPANLAPVGAIALFGGAILPRKLGWWLPLAVMVASDLIIGFYDGIAFTWLGFLLVSLFGTTLTARSHWFRISAGALGSAVIFFIVSNFGVWLMGNLYPLTLAGLLHCYDMALPFFRNTLLGDALYGALLFGLYAFAVRRTANHALETA